MGVGRKTGGLAVAVAVVTAVYAIKSAFGSRRDHNLAQGLTAMEDGAYATAVEYLEMVVAKDLRVLRALSECHEQLGNLNDAIAYLSMCIEDGGRMECKRPLDSIIDFVAGDGPTRPKQSQTDWAVVEKFVQRRLVLYKKAGLFYPALKDALTLSLLSESEEHKRAVHESLRACSLERVRHHKIEGRASDVNFSDFFQTLFFLENTQDPAVVFINSGEYVKCYDCVKDSDSELHRFLMGCFVYVNGNPGEALRIFRDGTLIYDSVLALYLRMVVGVSSPAGRAGLLIPDENGRKSDMAVIRVDAQEGSDDVQEDSNSTKEKSSLAKEGLSLVRERLSTDEFKKFAELMKSKDPTVQFYMAKIFEGLKMTDRQGVFLDACLGTRRSAVALGCKIVMLIKAGKSDAATSLIQEAVEEFPDDVNLYCIATEYFLHRGDIEQAYALFHRIQHLHSEDPRVCIFKYLLSRAAGTPQPGHLREGIRADSRYLKTYIHLGNHLMGTPECVDAYREALCCARSIPELFTVYQMLSVVEAEQSLIKEFPDLFG